MKRKRILLKGTKTTVGEADQRTLENYLTNYEIHEFPRNEAAYSLTNEDGFDIEIELFGKQYQLEVYPNELRTDDHQGAIDGKQVEAKSPCSTFKGTVKGTDRAVRLSINESGISGFIQLEDQKLFIMKSIKFKLQGGRPTLFVAYYEKDVDDKNDMHCGVTSEHDRPIMKTLPKPSDLGSTSSDCKVLKIATDADYAFFQIYGTSANAEILDIINLIEGVYVDTFNVLLRVSFQNVWTTNDPYTGDPSTPAGAELLLDQLRNYWQTNFTGVLRDVVHLFTGVNAHISGTAGIAYLGTICKNPPKAYGITRERFQQFLTTAHEIGHNFNGEHYDGVNCLTPSASLMCQDMKQIPMYFSPASITRISNFINANSACLSPTLFYRILGNTLICGDGTGTFIVPNLSSTDSAVWSVIPTEAGTLSGSGNSRTLTKSPNYNGFARLSVVITANCGIINISKPLTLGTPSPYDGGFYNDDPNNVPFTSTYNIVYNRRIYISLKGSSNEFTWVGFHTNGNVTWHHPAGYSGLIIDFGDPLPALPGDSIEFSVNRTNACGINSAPFYFQYQGPPVYM